MMFVLLKKVCTFFWRMTPPPHLKLIFCTKLQPKINNVNINDVNKYFLVTIVQLKTLLFS